MFPPKERKKYIGGTYFVPSLLKYVTLRRRGKKGEGQEEEGGKRGVCGKRKEGKGEGQEEEGGKRGMGRRGRK